MIYYVEEQSDGYAVICRGNDRAAAVGLTETQAERRAHEFRLAYRRYAKATE